jgi:hypothetical protein
MREFNGMLTSISRQHVSTRRPRGPTLCSAMRPHESRLLGSSRLANPNANTSGLLAARSRGLRATCIPLALRYGPHYLQLSGYRFSQSRDPRAQILGPFLARPRYTIPRADPTVLLRSGSNGYHLLASRVLVTLSTQHLGSQPATPEFARSLDL